jgi:ATP-binding cassette subfamily F protein 3
VIIGKNLTKTFIGEPILENIDFKAGNNRKVGVVGRNGCGKTTMFKLIVGEEPVDAGALQLEKEKIAYIPQEFSFGVELLVGEYLEGFLENHYDTFKIDILVSQLEFKNYDPYPPIKTLSEGQKMKLKMIEVLLQEPTTILIDEPTNHLDIEGILWFEQYIKELDKTVLMISHDRQFLNNTVDEIWEIENKKVLRFVGDYDFYKEEKLRLINKWDEEYVRFLKHKKKLETLLKNARKIKDGKARGSAVQAAKTRMRRELEERKVDKYKNKKMQAVTFDTDICHSKLMLRFADVEKTFGNNTVFKDLSFDIRGGQKVWLFGPNGAGKTTIVKMIMGGGIVLCG